jgi:hypothetical protein
MLATTTIRFAAFFLLAASSTALAQPWSGQGRDKTLGDFSVELFAGGEYFFDTGIDSSGRVEYARVGGGFSFFTDPEEAFSLNLTGTYLYDDYGFGRSTAIFQQLPVLGVREPWDAIHTYGIDLTMLADVNDNLRFFGGGVFNYSGDISARWDDAITGGGFAGLAYRLSRDLAIGGGVGAMYELEDDIQFFPIFYLDWQITNNMSIQSTPVSMAGTRWSSVELVFEIDKKWDLATGGGYDTRRFRLDSQADAPRGVGEFSSIPFWGRITYQPSPNLTFSAYIATAFDGEIGLSDNDGKVIDKSDFSAPIVIGGNFSVRF